MHEMLEMCSSTRVSSIAVFVVLVSGSVGSASVLVRDQNTYIAEIQTVMSKLLKHPVKGPSIGEAGAMAKYTKIGNLDTAIKDFYSVKPVLYGLPASGIYKAKGKVLLGRVGEHRIRLVEKGTKDGRYPVLEFTDTKNAHIGPGVHRIIYKKEDID